MELGRVLGGQYCNIEGGGVGYHQVVLNCFQVYKYEVPAVGVQVRGEKDYNISIQEVN